MTMDKSLRLRTGLVRARSVLSRAERIERLKASDRWKEGDDPLGLPKVRVYKLGLKKKKKKAKEGEEEAAAAGAPGTPGTAGAAPAAPGSKTPAAKTPASKTPAAKTPAAKTPASKTAGK